MFDRLRSLLLRWLRVPPEPEPPIGRADSIRVFRAGRNFYRLRLLRWGIGQVAAAVGIVFGLTILYAAEHGSDARRAARLVAPKPTPVEQATNPVSATELTNATAGTNATRSARRRRQPLPNQMWEAAASVPTGVFLLFRVIEGVGLLVFLGQLAVTYAAVRLDFELRWYVVTDRSLRIREGLWDVKEMTMSFANLQQVMLSQGPLQRLLGIADVRVQSAGGGGQSAEAHGQHQESLHTGIFHGVENATEIRDLILDRLRQFRETGLGDPDEPRAAAPRLAEPHAPAADETATLAAARELLAEARALRAECSGAAPDGGGHRFGAAGRPGGTGAGSGRASG